MGRTGVLRDANDPGQLSIMRTARRAVEAWGPSVGPEGVSRAATNLALIGIGLQLCFREQRT